MIAPDGEIVLKGPHVFMGYYKNPERTAETIVNGWLHTGDVGAMDNEGFVKITDRKKVTSALQACGLAGYRNDGDFSVARQLRDVLSSSVMINNDRILGNVASAALLVEVPALLTD